MYAGLLPSASAIRCMLTSFGIFPFSQFQMCCFVVLGLTFSANPACVMSRAIRR